MKTSKKYIVSKLKEIYKSADRTRLFKFFYEQTGLHGESNSWNTKMVKFFSSFCTSEKMRRVIESLCETKFLAEKRKYQFERSHLEFIGERPRPSLSEITRRERATALKMLRRLYEEPVTSYTKVAMNGLTHLYFCSPSYGHKDYNKVRTCVLNGPLTNGKDGNRYDPQAMWCEKVVELSDRIYSRKADK